MDNLKSYISSFLSRKGGWVISSLVIGKLLIFLSSWIALKLLSNEDLGYLLFALNIILFFIPIAGLGASHGLLRFGSLQENSISPQYMLIDVFKKGFIFSFILIVCIALLSGVLTANMPDSRPYLLALSLLLLTLFLLECTKTYYRVIGKNEVYAKIEITYAVILLIAVIPACSFFGVWGYLGALVFTPLLIALYYLPKNISYDSTTKRLQKGFWRYSFFTGLSNSVTQLLAVVDIILIGYLLQDPGQVTLYKYLTLIPMSLVLLPNAFLMTDFVSLTAKIKDKKYIAHYIKQYISFFLFIILGIWTIHFLFIEHILNFFGREFTSYKKLYYFLLLGISAVILIRILFGNLISALGRAKVNLWIAGFSVILNFFLNLYFIPKKGILGAAITSSVTMWVSSLLSMFCYYYFLKKPSE